MELAARAQVRFEHAQAAYARKLAEREAPAQACGKPPRGKAPEPGVEGDRLTIPLDGSMALDEMDCYIIRTALDRSAHNVTAAARALGTTRETLRYRIQKYGIKHNEPRNSGVNATLGGGSPSHN